MGAFVFAESIVEAFENIVVFNCVFNSITNDAAE